MGIFARIIPCQGSGSKELISLRFGLFLSQNRSGSLFGCPGVGFSRFWHLVKKVVPEGSFHGASGCFWARIALGVFFGVWGLDFQVFGSLLGKWLRSALFVVFRVGFEAESPWESFWLPGGWIFEVFDFAWKMAPEGSFHSASGYFGCRIALGVF